MYKIEMSLHVYIKFESAIYRIRDWCVVLVAVVLCAYTVYDMMLNFIVNTNVGEREKLNRMEENKNNFYIVMKINQIERKGSTKQ